MRSSPASLVRRGTRIFQKQWIVVREEKPTLRIVRIPKQGRSICVVERLGSWPPLQHHPPGFSALHLSVYDERNETESSRCSDSKSDQPGSPERRIHVSKVPNQQQIDDYI